MARTGQNAAELKIVADPAALYAEGAQEFTRSAESAIARRGRFSVALSGGNTPRGVYSLLAEQAKVALAW
ncbi:MAG TPA: 6-phosphogluconolactonase, partial [Candidatus Angelobacter sp.]|nr:6-phosphogluconolactonase [Candidatus Angelobacter sp.]